MSFSKYDRKPTRGKGGLFDGYAENMVSNNTNEIPIWEKSNLTIREAAEYSNIGINRIDQLLKMPNCKFVLYVGKKKLVKRREFDKFLSETVKI